MTRERLEDFHIERFLAVFGIAPDEKPRPSEAPDCLLRLRGRVVGIEHTEYYFPADPGKIPQQQMDAYQELAIEKARRVFRERGGSPLYVYPLFEESRAPRSKRESYDLAERFAAVVARNGWPSPPRYQRYETWREIPEIHSYVVMASLDGKNELWHGGHGGMVATITPQQVQDCLDSKASAYTRYRKRAPEVWLLVVNDMIRAGTPCEIGDDARVDSYVSPFDRVFWLELISDVVTELQVRHAQEPAS